MSITQESIPAAPVSGDSAPSERRSGPSERRSGRAERRSGPAEGRRRRGERGEGVISTALAVLIVAFLGIALWTGFSAMMNDATERTRTQVEQIGG